MDCGRDHYRFHLFIFQSDGTILGYFGNAFSKNRGIGQRGNLRVPRKVLRRILMEQLKATKIHWGYRLDDYSFDSENSNYTIQFSEVQNLSSIAMTSSETTKTVAADLLVAADGIRSAILAKVYRSVHSVSTSVLVSDEEVQADDNVNHDVPFASHELGLRSMGVRLILGIADFSHPLLNERGFYTLDGKHRLFTMPYSSDRISKKDTTRIMWQLSFSTDGACPPPSLEAIALRDYVVRTCSSWHDPVLDMIQATPLDKIWGT